MLNRSIYLWYIYWRWRVASGSHSDCRASDTHVLDTPFRIYTNKPNWTWALTSLTILNRVPDLHRSGVNQMVRAWFWPRYLPCVKYWYTSNVSSLRLWAIAGPIFLLFKGSFIHLRWNHLQCYPVIINIPFITKKNIIFAI